MNNIKFDIIEVLENTSRPGMYDMINWLENDSDFFTAPASTKHHYAFEGGLALHSLSVRDAMHNLNGCFDGIVDSYPYSIDIVSLLHDICKTNYYVKKQIWYDPIKQSQHDVEYVVDDKLPLGHGEKSLVLISQFLNLTTEEACAVRWHMGSWTPGVIQDPRTFNEAAKYPLVTLLIAADNISSRLLER